MASGAMLVILSARETFARHAEVAGGGANTTLRSATLGFWRNLRQNFIPPSVLLKDPHLLCDVLGAFLRGLDFHGSSLATFEKDGERWVALKPVVQGMGMSWGSQHTKLSAEPSRFNYTVIGTVGADGHARDMAAIPLRRYPMWLATINPAEIPNPAVRQLTFG